MIKKNKFIVYWAGYLYSPSQTLDKCPDYVNTVVIAFISPDKNSEVETKFLHKIFPKKQIKDWIKILKSRKIKVLLSILDTPNKHWDTVDFNIFSNSLRKIMIDWDIDGFDIDAESGEKSDNFVNSFINLINCVRKVIGPKKILSYTCYEGKYGFDGEILSKTSKKINYIQTMAYFYDYDEMIKLYDYYKDFMGNKILIGVKAGKKGDQFTPLSELKNICLWNNNKMGIMLWTFNRDNFSYTHNTEWIWCETINKYLNAQIKKSSSFELSQNSKCLIS